VDVPWPGTRAVRQLLSALHQLSQGKNADGSGDRGNGLTAAGSGLCRHDAAVQARPTSPQSALVTRQQQRPRTCSLRRSGQARSSCTGNLPMTHDAETGAINRLHFLTRPISMEESKNR